MEDYKGRGCACAPGTHESLVSIVSTRVPKKARILDIGAHAGALLMRFRDAGYESLAGTDLDDTRFNVPGADFRRMELNRAFSEDFSEPFDLITCTDVIEHLDSPRNFVAECAKMLAPDGRLALSMPNVAFWEGRIKFLLTGELWGFGDKNYRSQRHISPMTSEQLSLMLQELGFEVEAMQTVGSFSTWLRDVVLLPIRVPMLLIGGKKAAGECLVVLAKKSRVDEELKRPTHYRDRWAGKADNIGIEHLSKAG